MRRFFRLAVAAVRLFWGELRKGPRAAWQLIKDGFSALFGKAGALDRYRDSAVVQDVRRAATERRWAPERKARDEARAAQHRKRRTRRAGENLSLQLGLGLLRQGRVVEAREVIADALVKHPESESLRSAAGVIEGEHRVLSGEWRPHPQERTVERTPQRVLHVVGKSLPHAIAGYTVRTQSVATAQRGAGLDPVVVTKLGFPGIEGVEDAGPVDDIDGIRYLRTGNGEIPDRWDERLDTNLSALFEVVEQEQPSLLHAHSDFENALLALRLRERYGIPVVYEVRGFWEETWLSKGVDRSERAERYSWRRDRELQSMREADLVVTLAPTMMERMVGDGIDPDRIVMVPNAVDPDSFPEFRGRDEEVAAELGIGDAELVVGYISSLVGYEGVDTLIDAVAVLARRGVDVRGVIVGDGEERESLEHHARREGVAGRMIFTGRVPHDAVAGYYRALDIFVVPRRNDRVCRLVTPLKPFEAMSMGRPLVVSDVPALADIASESGAGAVFRAEDPKDLADVLQRLAGDRTALAEMGHVGADWVRTSRTWAANGLRYAEAFADHGLI